MFKSSDDNNIDEEYLSDVFDVPSTNKRNSDPLNDQPVKKICTQSPDNTKNILTAIQSNSYSRPKNTSPNKSVFNLSANQEKHRRVVQRKFPGPAGILPELKQLNINIKTLKESDTSVNNKTLQSDEIVCSQLSENIFRNGPWLKMITDWSTIFNRISLPNKYTVEWIKSKAVSKKLIGQKTPFLAATIQTIDCSNKDPMILLKDKTGDIHATLLHEVWEEYCDYLKPGSVIVLKQVGVLSTSKKLYLAITLNNLVTIYSEQENEETGRTVESINVQEITVEEFIKTIENIKQNHNAQNLLQKIGSKTNNNPYFKKPNTVLQKSPEIPIYKPIKNDIKLHNETNVNRTPKQFKFKTNNICESKQVPIPSTENNIITNTEEENIIITEVLDGVDTHLLFEDF